MAIPTEAASERCDLLERLLREKHHVLRRQALRHTVGAAGADDAMQRAAEQFLRYYAGGPGLEHALRWMMVAVKHAAWKERQALIAIDALDAGAIIEDDRRGPAEAAEAAGLLSARVAQLQRLKPDERTALLLFGYGLSYEEIAAARGWTYSKVNRCISEGRSALRKMEGGEK
jgi:DNA-directed RNA polymerase specialized sigma24 family protein